MSSFFRKALGLFIVLDEEQPGKQGVPQAQEVNPAANTPAASPPAASPAPTAKPATLSAEDLSKFEAHFAQLFDQANLPGPDYYEFWKTMDTLESHISDEPERMRVVFASLKIQGLNKQILLDSAAVYREVILKDKASFEAAVQKKSEADISSREAAIAQMEQERKDKQKQIEQLQLEIEQSAGKIVNLQNEIAAERVKIDTAQRGYLAACTAMVSKIEKDIDRFHQIIE